MKRRILKVTGIILLAIFLGIAGVLAFVKTMLPNVGAAPDIHFSSKPELVKRGEYLANHVMVCVDCHSTRDFSKFSGPIVPGTEGGGGEVFDQEKGFPGKFYAKNITPYGLGNWTDGEIFRAITTGVSRNGIALFPIMPYQHYGQMDNEDAYAIIAYIRTLPAIKKDIPVSEPDFPMNFIINTIPAKGAPRHRPDKSQLQQYGEYITLVADCETCHTRQEKGSPVGAPFAGNFEFNMPFGTLRSPNITPDMETGIGSWDEQTFIHKFRSYAMDSLAQVKPGAFNTPMPWSMYGGMDTTDLKAIYAYLRTLQPVKSKVVRFTPRQ